MEIRSLCPFSVGTLLWEAQPGQLSLSVVVKATLSLVPDGEAIPATEQVAIASDMFWDNDAQTSLYCPGDSVPVKRRVDVILSGHAYAPDATPVESLVATLKVGDFSKSVRVTGDRVWTRASGGPLTEGRPTPFMRMPLRYDRGRRSPDNPGGVEPDATPEAGEIAAPNLEPLSPHAMPGFGPVSPTWPSRRILLPDAALAWAYAVAAGEPAGPAPPSFNFEFFNAAPRDQQIDLLRAGAVIELESLHPRIPRLRTTLPPIRPQVFRMTPATGRTEEIILRCDTLWIDADRSVVVLSFRGLTDLGGMDRGAVGDLTVVADPQGKKLRFDKIEKQIRESGPSGGDADPLALRHDAVKSAAQNPAEQTHTQTARLDQQLLERLEQTHDIPGAPRRAPLPFVAGDAKRASPAPAAGAPKAPAAPRPGTAPKAAPTATKGDSEADRTRDVGQLPSRAALPFQQRLAAAAAKRGEAAPPRPAPPRRTEPPRAETPRAETTLQIEPAPQTEPPRAELLPQTEPPRIEPPRIEPPRIEPPRIEPPRTEPPRIEPPRIEPPRIEPPRGASPRHEPARIELSRPVVPPPAPIAMPPLAPVSAEVEDPDPDAITAEKVKKAPRADVALPPKPALVSLPDPRPPAPAPIAPPEPPPEPEQLGYREKKPATLPAVDPAAIAAAEAAMAQAAKPKDPEPEVTPAKFTIEQYAAISAELAQKGADRAAVLRRHTLTPAAWTAIDQHWTKAIAEQTERGERTLLNAFDEAYVATQGRLRKPIGVPEYARILVGLERGEVGRVLADLELQLSDLMRLQRVWTKKIADAPKLANELNQAVDAARKS